MSVVAEIKNAFLALVVLHFAAFLVMVGYRFHTLQYYKGEAAMAQELTLQKEEQARALLSTTTNETNPLQAYEATIKLLSKDISEAQETINARTQSLSSHVDTLGTLEQTVEELLQRKDIDRRPKSDVESRHLKKLLKTKSLREIPNDQLQQVFGHALQELVAMQGEDAVQQLNVPAVKKQPREFVCPSVQPVIGNNDDDDDDIIIKQRSLDAAYESDLEAYLEKFQSKFANRIQANGIQALLPKSFELVEDEFEDQVEIVLEDIVAFAEDLDDRFENVVDNKSPSSCNIDTELVTAMISAGLDAQVARADVQEALRRSILQHDPQLSVDDLILDADLGGSGSCGGSSGLESINLRSKIDTPLLIQSIDWIDALVDAIGGYNDGIDQYLDSLTGLHGTTSVGEIVVEGILEQAGKAGDIEVDKYWKEAKEIIHSVTGKKF